MCNISPAILAAYACTDPLEKARLATKVYADLSNGIYSHAAPISIDLRPGRPAKPELLAPRFLPRRRISKGKDGRIALLHAIAHIELNAIDLSLDIAVRFTDYGLPFDFVRDWLSVASDEARHFTLLHHRLEGLGKFYGALKPPFNIPARTAARFSSAFYGPLAAEQARAEQAKIDQAKTEHLRQNQPN